MDYSTPEITSMIVTSKPVPVVCITKTFICDDCNGEVVRDTDVVYLSYPPLYSHKCTKCNKQYNLTEQYPQKHFVPENETCTV